MGLVAREIEGRGIPTLSLSSALSITRSVGTPRAAFVDHPLGHTAGKPGEPAEQRALLTAALKLFETLDEPGEIVPMPSTWAEDDAWKAQAERTDAAKGDASGQDDRTERLATPQYQSDGDRRLAEQALAAGGCATCVFPD